MTTRTRLVSLSRGLSLTVVISIVLFGIPSEALATPGSAHGNYFWYKPGSTAINGQLRNYTGYVLAGTVTAGSGYTSYWNDPCVTDKGRLPDGWYNTQSSKHHEDNRDSVIKGRAWRLTDKACSDGTVRWGLFIHTEETKDNAQYCPTSGDDPYCWEGSNDYYSKGCIKVSHPTGIATVHSWWHNSPWSGGHDVFYSHILWVGASSPPL